MKSFLEETLDSILHDKESLEGSVLVLPSKRAGLFFKKIYAEKCNTASLLPKIYSIESFIEELSGLKIATPLVQLFHFYEAYKSVIPESEREGFSSVLRWAPLLLKDFSDIDSHLVSPETIFSALENFYALESFNTTKKSTSFWPYAFDLYKAFQALMEDKQLGTAGQCYRMAVDNIHLYIDAINTPHYLIGFNALNKAEEWIFQEFLSSQKGEIFWDLDSFFYQNEEYAVDHFIRRFQSQWPHYRKHPLSFENTYFASHKKIHLYGIPQRTAQVKYAGALLDTLTEADSLSKTAVVLGDESLLNPLLSALPSDLTHWNVTMGYGLGQSQVATFITALFQMHLQREGDMLIIKSVQKLISHELVRVHLSPKDYEKIIATLDTSLQFRIKSTALDLPEEIKPLFLSFDHLSEFLTRGKTFFNRCTSAIDHKGIPSASLHALLRLWNEMSVWVNKTDDIQDLAVLYHLYKELVKTASLDFKGDPIQGVQIMGMLETRVLDFENVIITQVNEGVLPMGKKENSFIPFSIKKAHDLPTFLEKDAIYTYHFYRLLQRAKNIHLFYSTASEGIQAGEKSRFLYQLTLNSLPQHELTEHQLSQHVLFEQHKRDEIQKDASMLAQLARIAEKGFSPSSLGTYLKDPFDFYLERIVKISDQNFFENQLHPKDRGTLVHETLEDLYTPYVGSVMKPEDYDKMQKKVSGLLKEKFALLSPVNPTLTGPNALVISSYERSIRLFLKEEKKRILQGYTIEILALEKPFSFSISIPNFEKPIKVLGTIDRLDKYNGQVRVLDYKTGNIDDTKLRYDDFEDLKGDYKRLPLFQLLMYALSLKEEKLDYGLPIGGIVPLHAPSNYVYLSGKKGSKRGEVETLITLEVQESFKTFLVEVLTELFDLKKSFVSLSEGP